ncbi:hypothetical protein Vafri_5754 [Volvox africanus]|nr:hypothetical protein Vafri_5754 [Volvox africanus]
MVQLVRPKYIQELAALLDVKAAPEWALPYALASIPLPEGWTCLVADDESVLFVSDLRPQAPQREHPLLGRAAEALAQLRANGTGGGSEVRMLGPFENPESPAVEYFYIDIHTGQQVPEFECSPGTTIQSLPQEILQLLTAPGSPPRVPDQQQQQQQDPEHSAGHEADAQPSPLGGDTNVSVDESVGPPSAGAKPAAMPGRTSRPQSASSSTSRSGSARNAAGGVAAGSQSPSSSASASKLPRRQGSDSNADSWQETGGVGVGGDGGGAPGAGAEPAASTAASYPRHVPTDSASSPTQPVPPLLAAPKVWG